MKKIFTYSMILLFTTKCFSQNVQLTNNLINAYEERTNIQNQIAKYGRTYFTCTNDLLRDAEKNWSSLTPQGKSYFGSRGSRSARPTLSGSEQIFSTTNFDFHYTVSGRDAVPPADNDVNGTPDYVDTMAMVFEYVWGL